MNEHTVTIVELIVIAIIYFVPTIVAFARDIPQRFPIAVLNVIIGWTLIGWFVLFIWANLARPSMEQPV